MSQKDLQKQLQAVDCLSRHCGNMSAAAHELGITRASLRGRLSGVDLSSYKLSPSPEAQEDEVSVARTASTHAQLQAQLKRLMKRLVEAEDVRAGVLGLMDPPLKARLSYAAPDRAIGATTVILHLSDLHAGEKISRAEMDGLNSFDLDIFRKRIGRLFTKAGDLLTTHWKGAPPERIIVILGGDLISGEIHEELAKTNDALSAPAVRECAERLAGGLALLRSVVGVPIDVVSVPGNHGRLTRKPEAKGAGIHSFDWLVANFVEMMMRSDPGVTFHYSDSPDCPLELYGRLFIITHGDRIGSRGGTGFVGPVATIARGMQKVYQDYAARGKAPYKILIGHFHTTSMLPLGISNGSLPGPSEYSRDLRAIAEPSSQNLLVIHSERGLIDLKQIYCGAPDEGLIYQGGKA